MLTLLCCPNDRQSLELIAPVAGAPGTIVAGTLVCSACGARFSIRDGIPDFVGVIGDEDAQRARMQAAEVEVRDREAAIYDERVPQPVASAEESSLTRLLELEPSHRLLDLGCGTGRMTMHFARHAGTVVGVDLSLESLRVFRQQLPGDLAASVHLVRGDLHRLPLRDQSFDRAVSHSVFQHLPSLTDSREPVVEAARVLRPNGRFVLGVYRFTRVRAALARLLPGLTYGGGYHREGTHAGKVYYRRYRPAELRDALGDVFHVEQTHGARIVPRFLLRRFGRVALALELGLQRIPAAGALAYYVMTVARKKLLHLVIWGAALAPLADLIELSS